MAKITVLTMVNAKVVFTCMMMLIMDDYCIYDDLLISSFHIVWFSCQTYLFMN